MQSVTNKTGSFAFIVLCGSKTSESKLHYCLDRINQLEIKNLDNILDIYVYLVPVSEDGNHIKGKKFQEYASTLININIIPVTNNTNYATEARAFNYGMDAFLEGPAQYVVCLHETDIILDLRLLEYYMWLFSTAHNSDVIGAVAPSSNVGFSTEPPTKVKMWYADDVYLRGVCIKRQAVKDTGPFDEMFLYRFFEFDFFSRMSHHAGWLTRIGKEKESFLQLADPDLTPDFRKMSFLKKQSMVWFAKKWHYKGVWEKPNPEGNKSNCCVRKNTFYTDGRRGNNFFDKFKLSKEEKKAVVNRQEILYSDKAIKNAINMSKSFKKKPLGHFTLPGTFELGVRIHNHQGIQTHVRCQLEHWDDLLWTPELVY